MPRKINKVRNWVQDFKKRAMLAQNQTAVGWYEIEVEQSMNKNMMRSRVKLQAEVIDNW